jgi:antitoxin component YwqK of YwqJK toxin-antitoxin module
VKGKANGHSITYYKNGKIQYKGEYEDGQRTGKWEFYDEQGELQREEEF